RRTRFRILLRTTQSIPSSWADGPSIGRRSARADRSMWRAAYMRLPLMVAALGLSCAPAEPGFRPVGVVRSPTVRATEPAAPIGRAPLRIWRRMVLVELRINGSAPLTFILDSGAGGTLIDASTAERLGLRLGGGVQSTGANGRVLARRGPPLRVTLG